MNALFRLYDLSAPLVRAADLLRPLLLLALRLYLASVFFRSGLTKIADWDTTLYLFTEEYAVPVLPPALAALMGTAGELLLPPLLALGLYRISWDVAEGRRPGFGRAITAWRRNPYHILTAGLILMLFVMIWARMNVIAFALFFPYVSMSLASFLHQTLTLDGMVFTMFVTVLGLGFATVAFISNVTALPMMLERKVDIFAAVLASAMAVARNPRTMALWAALIVLVTGVGLLSVVGLVVTLPLIGHASWHAYRDLVKADGEP